MSLKRRSRVVCFIKIIVWSGNIAASLKRARNLTFAPLFRIYSAKTSCSSNLSSRHTGSHSKTATRQDDTEIEPDYGFQEDVESFKGYVTGGYHPVHLGDEPATGRYRIIHKLGYGAYSTVWLARDQLAEKYVAVKIAVAGLDSAHEVSILRHLEDAKSKIPAGMGQNLVSSILDDFQLDGPMASTHVLSANPLAVLSQIRRRQTASGCSLWQQLELS